MSDIQYAVILGFLVMIVGMLWDIEVKLRRKP
jgi:hypothetical protein